MAEELKGRKVAILAADGVEAAELTGPRRALEEAGAEVHLVSLQPGEIQSVNGLEKGESFPVDLLVPDVKVVEYDGLVLPGGAASVAALRLDRQAVALVREFVRCDEPSDKPVGAVGEGPALLVEAGVVAGNVLTSQPSLQTDIRNAGGAWVDEEVRVDGCLITSRGPADLEDFGKRLVAAFAAGHAKGSGPTSDVVMKERVLDRAVEETFPASDPVPTPSKT